MTCHQRNLAWPLLLIICGSMMLLTESASARKKNGFDLTGSSIPARAIESGGPGRDGIPAINSPKFVAAQDAVFF